MDVSVIIPTRDRWTTHLRRTLATVLAQRDVALEVLVVDDGSTAPAPADLFPPGEDRVQVLRLERNRGQAVARNRGLARASGRWIAFLDDDDVWAPTKLRDQVGAAEAAGAVVAYASALVVDLDLTPTELLPAPPPNGLAETLLGGNIIPAGASNMLVRADVVHAEGGFDERLSQLADWDMWLRVLRHGPGSAVAPPLLGYVHHPGGAAMTDPRDPLDELDHLARKHPGVDVIGFVRWAAGRMRDNGHRRTAQRLYLRSGLRYRNGGNVARSVALFLGEGPMRAARGTGVVGAPPPVLPGATPAWLTELAGGA